MNTPCDENGCTVFEGEWCEIHQVERWGCTCTTIDGDPLCSFHGAFDWKGQPIIDPPDGYPPDGDQEATIVPLANGGAVIASRDATVGWYRATTALDSGLYVDLRGSEAFPYVWQPGTPPLAVTVTAAALGELVQCVVVRTVRTADDQVVPTNIADQEVDEV